MEGKEAESGTSGRNLRSAGTLEEFYRARSYLSYNTYVVVTARYEHPSGLPLSKHVLYPALEQAIRKQAVLAARLPSPPSPPVWISLPSVDLNKVVTFVDGDHGELGRVLEQIFAQPINYAQEDMPLWKLLVLPDWTIVFAYDHVLGDGQSGLAFHHTLLTSLRSIPESPSDHSGVVSTFPLVGSLTPALESAMDVSPPLLMVLWEVLNLIFPFLNRKAKTAWAGNPVVERLTLATTVRIVHFTPEEATGLIRLSREHRATVTSTLHTLAVLVLSRLIPAHSQDTQKYTTVKTIIPVSLRRSTGASPTAMCNHISFYPDYHPFLRTTREDSVVSPQTFPWDAAFTFTETLRREAPRTAPNMGMLKFLNGKYKEYFEGQLGKKRGDGLEISNLGAFPALPAQTEGTGAGGEAWDIGEVLFAQANATVGSALKLNVAGTPAGGLGVTVTWGKGAVDDELAEEFVHDLQVGVQNLLSS